MTPKALLPATVLKARGAGRGDRVAVFLPQDRKRDSVTHLSPCAIAVRCSSHSGPDALEFRLRTWRLGFVTDDAGLAAHGTDALADLR